MKETRDKIERKTIYIVTFFSYCGYKLGLAITISMGFMSYSSFYSVPVRMLTTVMMIGVIVYNIKSLYSNKRKDVIVMFIIFWLLYFAKVFYCYIEGFQLHMNWFEYILYSINFSFLPFLMYASIDFRKYRDTILNAFIFSGIMFGIISLYLYKDILSLQLGRISNITYIDSEYQTITPLTLSYGGTLTFALCMYKLLFSDTKLSFVIRCYLIIGLFVSTYIFLLGASRGSLIAIALCVPLFFIYKKLKGKLQFIIFLVLFIPLMSWAINYTGSSILERTSKTVESGDFTRGKLWEDAWTEFVNYPVLGNRIEIGFYPHNFVLETLMSTGFIGFFLLSIILMVALLRVYRISLKNQYFIIPFIILLQGFAASSFSGSIITATNLFLALGIIYSSYNSNTLS
jgi:hypothetical protein